MHHTILLLTLSLASALASAEAPDHPVGYYRQPCIQGNTIVFVAEGDLWKVGAGGGVATRLTSHPGDEGTPRISPDGKWVAFRAAYEGPAEIYVMPLEGGLPRRLTYDASRCAVVGWKAGAGGSPATVIAATTRLSGLPNTQLALIDPGTGAREVVPLAQASDGVYDDAGATLFFTRLAFQGSQTKRYKGGTAQNLWRYTDGQPEAVAMTSDFEGTSATPMWWSGRVYFLTDRDGTMEVFSMKPDGSDVRQETNHQGESERLLDVKGASISVGAGGGRIVYQLGADLWVYDTASRADTKLEIRLDSDFDQTREKWIEKPMDYLTAASVSPDGSRVVLTARGQVFVAPRETGRLAEIARKDGVRYRNARFMPDGKTLLMLSDESGEVELWTAPANGVGASTRLTTDGVVLRWEAVPSPDGTKIAHHDKNQKLWIYDTATKSSTNIDTNGVDNFSSLTWSPDSRYLAYVAFAKNFNRQVKIHDTRTGATLAATTDRFDTTDAAFSPDGKWLYVLSDRNISTVVGSPWGPMQPEPFFDKKTKVYAIALKKGTRSPWIAPDELASANPEEPKKDDARKDEAKKDVAAPEPPKDGAKPEEKKDEPPKVTPVELDADGLAERLVETPIPAGNYSGLSVNEKRVFFVTADYAGENQALAAVDVGHKDVEVKTLVKDVTGYELSRDGKSLLVRKKASIAVIEASAGANADLSKAGVDLSAWKFPIVPREEWRQMFVEAWRLERDYFYDTDMHGVNWAGLRDRYLALVDRVSTRDELADLIAQMVGELSALHIFVYGGDLRGSPSFIAPATLGAALARDEAAGGYRVTRIFQSDPDFPERRAPLARPGAEVGEGDVIEQINGRDTLGVADPAVLLRNTAGRQVLLKVKPKAGGESRSVIVTPIGVGSEDDLRYHEWEYTRRQMVEKEGRGEIGYVHLRAMGSENMNEFARGYYPVFDRKGLIIDVRHNRGGNIDSWILGRLLRRAWFFWQPRVGDPFWNMQLAFRGHVAVLCNERTASDGEAFSEGIKRLKIGTVIGTRTWGGEIWLSSSNFLVDGGIATAAEIGVYGPEGEWLIEGRGVEPDVVVDNPPHATFLGEDAQLKAAIAHLQKRIREQPIELPPAPRHPDKSWGPNSRR